MQIKILTRALVVALGASASACQQFSPDNETRTLSFNHSVAESTNQLLLLNIVRDSQRNPTYFTRLGSNSASSSISPNLSLTFPFGTLSSGQAATTPSASAQNSLNLENLDDHKYQAGAMRRIDMETVQTFWDEGIQPDALGLLFISTIAFPKAEMPILLD